jgi:hypothetical protein
MSRLPVLTFSDLRAAVESRKPIGTDAQRGMDSVHTFLGKTALVASIFLLALLIAYLTS